MRGWPGYPLPYPLGGIPARRAIEDLYGAGGAAAATLGALTLVAEGTVTASVPVDGPGSVVYCPITADHWSNLSIATPTLCYGCQDTSGNLLPSIGSIELAPNASPLYAQTVTNWTRTFVGTVDTTAEQRFASADASLSLSSGESVAMLVYMSAAVVSGTARLFNVASHAWALQMSGNGNITGRFNNVAATGSNHESLTTVHPYLWVRNATADTCKVFSDLQEVTGTHSEIAVTIVGMGIGALAAGVAADSRVGLIAYWKGASAEGLGKATLQALGWSLAY